MGFVIVDGGLVQEASKDVEVFDLDCTHDQFPDANTWAEVEAVRDRLEALTIAPWEDITWAVRQTNEWLLRQLDQVCPNPENYEVVAGQVRFKED